MLGIGLGILLHLLYIGLSLLTANCNCAKQEKCPFVALQMFLRRNPPTVGLPHNFSHGRIKAAERPFKGLKYRMGNVKVKYLYPCKDIRIYILLQIIEVVTV